MIGQSTKGMNFFLEKVSDLVLFATNTFLQTLRPNNNSIQKHLNSNTQFTYTSSVSNAILKSNCI